MSTLFSQIIEKKIPAEILHETDEYIVIRDIKPQAPTHLLIIPKKIIPRIAAATEADAGLLGHLLLESGLLAKKLGISNDGFRLVINNGPDAGETVPHLHIHLLAGRRLNWPPG